MSYLLPTYGKFPLTLIRGEGTRVWDDADNSYLDFCAGIATCSIGHCHPAQTQAISQQSATLIHCSNLYHIPQQEKLAKTLVEKVVQAPGKIFFANSGAEANDGMIKTARKFGHAHPNKNNDARYEVITFSNSFHGRTLGSMAATAQKKIQQGFDPMLPGFRYAPFNDCHALSEAISEHTVAIMLEPIQGEGGINVATPEFLTHITKLSQEHNLLILLDEIQCGIGRTGTMNGWQSICPEMRPDCISWAKGMGGGFPIGSFYVSDRPIDDHGTPLSSLMHAGSHGSTYGGNPLACSSAQATIDEILLHDLSANAHQQGKHIKEQILKWSEPAIHEIRGKGLLIGLALSHDALHPPQDTTPALHLCKALMQNGLLTVPAGESTLRLLPPLNISREDVDAALKILKNTLISLT